MKKQKLEEEGESVKPLRTGEWYDFNDGKYYLHSISIAQVGKEVKLALLLEDWSGMLTTLVFPATARDEKFR